MWGEAVASPRALWWDMEEEYLFPKRASFGNHERADVGRSVQGKELEGAIINTQARTQ